MNAETLGALANIVNEAIAKAVQPLQQRIAELGGRKYATPEDVGAAEQASHDRARALETRVKALESAEHPAPYDDSALRKDFDEALADTDRRVELAQKMAVYDDQWIRQTFDAVQATLDQLKAVEPPKPYDDAPLRQEISEAIKFCTSAQDDLLAHIKRLDERSAPTPGTDGKDALALEVLPEIDQAKSYVRNTYAKHNGGLWRSFEQTHGMRGWEVIVDGVHAVMPVLEGKSLTVRVIQSSGTESVLMADLPIQAYKGVYRPEGEYVAHDTATWAGSLWHCNVTGTKAKPGDGSSDWTLAVKKGRDAKEVVRV